MRGWSGVGEREAIKLNRVGIWSCPVALVMRQIFAYNNTPDFGGNIKLATLEASNYF